MRIFVADADEIFRAGMQSLFAQEPGFSWAGQAGAAEQTLDMVCRLQPDVVLMDLHFPDAPGLEVLDGLARLQPRPNAVVFTADDSIETLLEVLRRGARGFIAKGVPWPELLGALRAVQRGEAALSRKNTTRLVQALPKLGTPDGDHAQRVLAALTTREAAVLAHLGAGATNQQIARDLVISPHTVKVHVRHILAKLKLRNRAQAAALARRYWLGDPATEGMAASAPRPLNGAQGGSSQAEHGAAQ